MPFYFSTLSVLEYFFTSWRGPHWKGTHSAIKSHLCRVPASINKRASIQWRTQPWPLWLLGGSAKDFLSPLLYIFFKTAIILLFFFVDNTPRLSCKGARNVFNPRMTSPKTFWRVPYWERALLFGVKVTHLFLGKSYLVSPPAARHFELEFDWMCTGFAGVTGEGPHTHTSFGTVHKTTRRTWGRLTFKIRSIFLYIMKC